MQVVQAGKVMSKGQDPPFPRSLVPSVIEKEILR